MLLVFGLLTPLGVLLCLSAVAVALIGPGALSLDRGRRWVRRAACQGHLALLLAAVPNSAAVRDYPGSIAEELGT